jgi:hypothetical protein
MLEKTEKRMDNGPKRLTFYDILGQKPVKNWTFRPKNDHFLSIWYQISLSSSCVGSAKHRPGITL